MHVRLPLALLCAATALAACEPQPPATTVTVDPGATTGTITSTTPAAVTVIPETTTTVTSVP